MGRFDKYKIDLKGMHESTMNCAFELDNQFFIDIDGPEVSKGKVHVALTVKKLMGDNAFELFFQTEGVIQVPCDRCLDDMDLDVSTQDKVMVKLGADYAEDGDWVIVPEEEGDINVAWFIYEFIALSIPMKHVHAPGKCNKAMAGKLGKHLRVDADDNESMDLESGVVDSDLESVDSPVDPRWNELKKIIDNN